MTNSYTTIFLKNGELRGNLATNYEQNGHIYNKYVMRLLMSSWYRLPTRMTPMKYWTQGSKY